MKIAVLGLGIIGSAWAKNLIADGHDVRCWNRTPKEFPNFHSSIQDAVADTEVIFIVVADPPAVQSVIEQIKPRLRAAQTVVQSSTISAHWTHQFAKEVEATGALFLEAPFTGSKIAAEQRKTVYYLGGESEVIEKVRPVLERLAGNILHIGARGTASTLKLAMNLNIASVAQALCESLTLCRAAGISDDTYFGALQVNVSRSGVADLKEPKLRNHDYSPQFSIKHMAKDLRLTLETANELQLSLSQTERVKSIYEQGIAAGWSDYDFISLVRLLERSTQS